MDRKPLAAPFPVGTKLRYVGTRNAAFIVDNGERIPYIAPGLEVTIDKVATGYRGTLRPLPGEWEDDDPPLDTTQDGYSAYRVHIPGREPQGRIIWPADAHEWEKV